jgi:hypothetical protein
VTGTNAGGPSQSMVREFVAHCHMERNHQGRETSFIDPRLIGLENVRLDQSTEANCGMLNYYTTVRPRDLSQSTFRSIRDAGKTAKRDPVIHKPSRAA